MLNLLHHKDKEGKSSHPIPPFKKLKGHKRVATSFSPFEKLKGHN
jgi:hypothetical protein